MPRRHLFLLLFIFGCDSLPIDHPFKGTFNGYVINKGDNNCDNLSLIPYDGNSLKFRFRFLGDVLHTPKDSAIQKLYGMSDYGSFHHNNSVRIGWRMRQEGTIDIFAYYYVDGKMGYTFLGNVELETEFDVELKIHDDEYIFIFREKLIKVKRSKSLKIGPRYRLFPYYEDGKGRGAPREMTFYIYEY